MVSDVAELYGLPLEQFVSERTATVKRLRASKCRAEANVVAAARKPTVAAWAVNQLVRTRRAEIAALFEAGDELQGAQLELLSGSGDARALRDATERERDARARLLGIARGLLSSTGDELSAATLERIGDTLRAAALDADARALVSHGCLERELRQIGLGTLPSEATAPRAAPPQPTRATNPNETQELDHELATARRRTELAARERAERLASLRQTEADAEHDLKRAENARERAQIRHERATAELAEAARALRAADSEIDRAAQRHRAAVEARAAAERAA